MQIVVNLLNDLIIIFGNLIIFSCMLNFKALNKFKKWLILVCCLIFAVAYSLCVYVAYVPIIHASIMCFTIPTIFLFWAISDIKDSRFFLTFCLVDTVSLIIGAITKFIAFSSGNIAPYVTFFVNLIIYTLIISLGHGFFTRYSKLLQFQKAGWVSMMIASFVIYFALYFLAAYPKPLQSRLEYAPSYFVFCFVVLACYVVFLDSIFKTKKLHEQYQELEKEKEFHKIAYMDSLTGLYNRVSYVEKINEFERNCEMYRNICCIVIDLNDFKSVNDNYGHHMGDLILQDTANNITSVFTNTPSYIFRISGDEFFILWPDADEEDVRNRLEKINGVIEHNDKLKDDILSVAYGYAFIDVKNDHPRLTIEQNFMKADKKMYENKKQYKLEHNID